MKLTFGRKFLAMIVAILLLGAIFFVTLAVYSQAITAGVMIAFGGFVLTVCFMYVGGNVWGAWIKSKHFHPEMLGK